MPAKLEIAETAGTIGFELVGFGRITELFEKPKDKSIGRGIVVELMLGAVAPREKSPDIKDEKFETMLSGASLKVGNCPGATLGGI